MRIEIIETALVARYKIGLLRASFSDIAQETNFRMSSIALDIIYTRRGLLIIGLLNLLFVFADKSVFPNESDFLYILSTRLTCFASGLGAWFYLRNSTSPKALDLTTLAFSYFTIGLIDLQLQGLISLSTSPPSLLDCLPPFVFCILIAFTLLPNPFIIQLAVAAGLIAIFVEIIVTNFPLNDPQLPFVITFLVLIVTGGIFISRRQNFTSRLLWVRMEQERLARDALEEEIVMRRALEEKLQRMALEDPLTKIGNRAYFYANSNREFDRSKRYGSKLSVLTLDIDLFKKVNDTFGHSVGDSVLIEISNTIKSTLRTTDILGRTGGEEFAIALPDTPLVEAKKTAEKIRLLIESLDVTSSENVIHSTVSIGVTEITGDDNELDDLLKRADVALYKSKRNGRNKVSTN